MIPPANIPASARACIACGGTGGHLFPGIAVGRKLLERGCEVSLMISPKEVDQEAVRDLAGVQVVTLPAVGLTSGARLAFVRGFIKSYRLSKRFFRQSPPSIALAMGGFTSAPPILAARSRGAATFLHESNSVPGRANCWLSRVVTEAFVGFPSAAQRLRSKRVQTTGTPVREEFFSLDPARCRTALGLDPRRPVVLIMGGSQGARGINQLLTESLPLLEDRLPDCQWLHIAGPGNADAVAAVYRARGIPALVYGFMNGAERAIGAATVGVSRAGASSLAELAAARIPAILVPYPAATDNHQYFNARAFADSGAALLLEQGKTDAKTFAAELVRLATDAAAREKMRDSLGQWSNPECAERIADEMLKAAGLRCHDISARARSQAGRSDDHGALSAREVAA